MTNDSSFLWWAVVKIGVPPVDYERYGGNSVNEGCDIMEGIYSRRNNFTGAA